MAKFPPDGHPYFPPPYMPTREPSQAWLWLWLVLILLVVLA